MTRTTTVPPAPEPQALICPFALFFTELWVQIRHHCIRTKSVSWYSKSYSVQSSLSSPRTMTSDSLCSSHEAQPLQMAVAFGSEQEQIFWNDFQFCFSSMALKTIIRGVMDQPYYDKPLWCSKKKCVRTSQANYFFQSISGSKAMDWNFPSVKYLHELVE